MAIKKSDLYSFLWASCDELRGGMDARQILYLRNDALESALLSILAKEDRELSLI